MTTNKTQQKPLILNLQEAKEELADCLNKIINNRQIPCYLLEPILKEFYSEVCGGARQELNAARSIPQEEKQ